MQTPRMITTLCSRWSYLDHEAFLQKYQMVDFQDGSVINQVLVAPTSPNQSIQIFLLLVLVLGIVQLKTIWPHVKISCLKMARTLKQNTDGVQLTVLSDNGD